MILVSVWSLTTPVSIFSWLPPSTTLRRYQRRIISTTATDLGALYCSIISFAVTHHDRRDKAQYNQEIVRSLIAIRAKLKRCCALKDNIIYEVCLLASAGHDIPKTSFIVFAARKVASRKIPESLRYPAPNRLPPVEPHVCSGTARRSMDVCVSSKDPVP